MNDIERQWDRRMLKELRDIRFIRTGKEALRTAQAFRQAFGESYESEGLAEQIFNEIERNLNVLIALKRN
jgi:hypothetical protein